MKPSVVFFEDQYLPIVVRCVIEAKKEILVAVYEWGWYEGQASGTIQDLNRTLCTVVIKGMKCRAILHNEGPGRTLGRMNRRAAAHLRRAGVDVRMGRTNKPVHAKLWVFDRERAIVCTHNISRRAVTCNAELGVLLEGDGEAARVADYFEGLWERFGLGLGESQA